MMASIIDNLTREDVVKMEIERRRMEELGRWFWCAMLIAAALFFVGCDYYNNYIR